MWTRRKLEGLIAKSLYEDLSEDETLFLEKHLPHFPDMEGERNALQAMVSAIPDDRPELDRDLAPLLRARLEEQSQRRSLHWGRWAVVVATCSVAVLFAVLALQNRESNDPATFHAAAPAEESSLNGVLAEADAFISQDKFTAAYQALSEGIEAHPRDARAGEAQLKLADLAFDSLCWYEEAYGAYEVLVQQYPKALESSQRSSDVADRRDLLAEARVSDYKCLEELQLAKNSTVNAFGELEKVIARYPNAPFVASRAANEMAQIALAEAESLPSEDARVMAMDIARKRCKDPIAKAQLSLEMGLVYSNNIKDFNRARTLFQQAANHPAVEGRAREAMERLASLGQ